VDLETLRDIGMLDPAGSTGLADVVNLFAVETPELLAQIGDSIEDDDLERMQAAAHKLKGSCGQIGAARLYVLALELDKLGKAALARMAAGEPASAREGAALFAALDETAPVTIAELRSILALASTRATARATGARSGIAPGAVDRAGEPASTERAVRLAGDNGHPDRPGIRLGGTSSGQVPE
jgi:HPt (histidine-containing phosphotransfer) domain-containing protein